MCLKNDQSNRSDCIRLPLLQSLFGQSVQDDKVICFTSLNRIQFISDYIFSYIMNEEVKKKAYLGTTKLPMINPGLQEKISNEKKLSDPPGLPISISKTNGGDQWTKLVDIFQRTQTQFSHIYRQILAMTERQNSFQETIIKYQQNAAPPQTNPSFHNQTSPAASELEARYRFFLTQVPFSREEKVDMEKLKRWVGKVLTETFSVAFNRFSKEEMNFDQTKIYCSSNILRNLVSLSDKIELTASQLQVIEEEMGRLLRYLQLKYPLTESTEINKALQGAVQEVDNMGLLAHNYFASSQLVFQYREGGNYNDLIMTMLNDIFSRIDDKSPACKQTNFNDFKSFMTNIFQSIQEEEQDNEDPIQEGPFPGLLDFITDRYVIAKSTKHRIEPKSGRTIKESKIRQEKEKYRNKVREYTNYSIGRKVPQSVPLYTDKDIDSMNLSIKAPSVLRILTKWVQQLRDKFTTPAYFTNLSDGIKSQSSDTVHSLLFPLRRLLDEQMRKEQQQIRGFLKGLSRDNFDLELKLLQREITKGVRPFDQLELETICGRYSIEVLNSLHSNLISYLNRLIHGLTSVAKRFYEKIKDESNQWHAPPDLVTFTIGDLLRCKISSRQLQILRIYDQLKQLSLENPEKLKIIRVKNRLNKSTNDILVNIKFNNMITGEIQLAVKRETSLFNKCSNQFCHYLYELERNPFGAISQLCNIWAALDRTAQSFKQLLQEQAAKQIPIRTHKCTLAPQQVIDRPFICHTCQVVYYHSNYLRSHVQCLQCRNIICAKCSLRRQDPLQLKTQLISNKALRANCVELVERLDTSYHLANRDVPEFGLCIYIERRSPKVEVFRMVNHSHKKYILGRQAGKVYQIEPIQTKKQMMNFLRNYLIFKLDPSTADSCVRISQEEALQTCILPKKLKAAYKKEKESLVVGDKLENEVLQNAMAAGPASSKQKIRKLFLDSNMIKSVQFIAQSFQKTVLLQLSYNPIQNLQGLDKLRYLKSLSLSGCQLTKLPESLFEVNSLEQLRLSSNYLTSINGVQNLNRLKLLDLSNNRFEELSAEIGECSTLLILRVESNQISRLPHNFNNLTQLRELYLSMNALQVLPPQIGALSSLQILNVRHNKLKTLPEELKNLNNLQKLNAESNQLSQVSNTIGQLYSLLRLDLSRNIQLRELPEAFEELSQLQELNLSACGFQQLPPAVCALQALRVLKISYNRIDSLPPLSNENLEYLDASNNKLQSDKIQQSFKGLVKLSSLNLRANCLQKLPNLFFCQQLLRVNFSSNQIVQITQNDITGMDTLQFCDLSYNQIVLVPDTLMALPKLKELNLSVNKLKRLGDAAKIWPNLLKINIAENQLQEIPACLLSGQHNVATSRVSSIDISKNQIEELPPELINLTHLRQLKCGQNKFKKVESQFEQLLKANKVEVDYNDKKTNLSKDTASPIFRRHFKSREQRRSIHHNP